MQNDIIKGMRDGFPIGLSYFTVAFSLGIIARFAGLDAITGFFSSFFIRASAGEYVLYSLMAGVTAIQEIVIMTMVANLRYLLMSTALTQKFRPDTSLWKRILLGCCMTDEVFGISIAYPGRLAPSYTFSAALLSGVCWASGTACGIYAGSILPADIVTALSISLYGMFLAIIIPPSKKDRMVALAVVTAFVVSWLSTIVPVICDISNGTRIIILTIIISVIFSIAKPVKE